MQRSTVILAVIALVLLLIIGGGVSALMQRSAAGPGPVEQQVVTPTGSSPLVNETIRAEFESGEDVATVRKFHWPILDETTQRVVSTTQVDPTFQAVMAERLTPFVMTTPMPGVSTLTTEQLEFQATVQADPTMHAYNALQYACSTDNAAACDLLEQYRP